MHRRALLKNIGIVSAGILFFPGCDAPPEEQKKMVAKIQDKLQVKEEEQALVKSLVSTLIPNGEIPGAAELDVDRYVWLMVDDCLPKDTQKRYMNGLENFGAYIEEKHLAPFYDLGPAQQLSCLSDTMNQAEPASVVIIPSSLANTRGPVNRPFWEPEPLAPGNYLGEMKFFLNMTKNFTIRGFLYSEYVMTKLMPYQLVPGKYNGCDTIDPSKKINIHA